jgi:hypothetical protein
VACVHAAFPVAHIQHPHYSKVTGCIGQVVGVEGLWSRTLGTPKIDIGHSQFHKLSFRAADSVNTPFSHVTIKARNVADTRPQQAIENVSKGLLV